MPTIAEQLTQDLAAAMRSGDTRKRDVIRFLRAGIKNAEIDRHRSLTDLEIQDLIRGQIKQRRDSIEMFRRGGREDLATEEQAQIALLEPYLPTQLSDEELDEIVARVAGDLGASTAKDMGRVMQAARAEIAARAEGKRISDAVKRELERRSASGSD